MIISDGGRGLVSVKECVGEEKCNPAKYVTQRKEALVKTAAAELGKVHYQCEQERKERKPIKRVKQKALNGKFVRKTECHKESKK